MTTTTRLLVALLGLTLAGMTACVPAPPGMDLFAYQYHQVSPTSQLRIPLQQVPIIGNWQNDIGYHANGPSQGTHFEIQLDLSAQGHVNNTRLPARWAFTIGHRCVNSIIIMDIPDVKEGEVADVVLPCERIDGIHPFSVVPDSADAQAMPASVLLSGEGIDPTYGMPEVDFFDPWGRLAGSVAVTSIGIDDQGVPWLIAPMPAIIFNGTYIIAVNQYQSDGTLDVIGTTTVEVTNGQDLPIYEPPPDPTPDPDGCVTHDCLVY